MQLHRTISSAATLAIAIGLAGCGGDPEPGATPAPTVTETVTATATETETPTQEPTSQAPATATEIMLDVGGLIAVTADGGTLLRFGDAQADVVAAVSAVYGAPTDTSRNEECGEGPVDFVTFGADDRTVISVNFQEGEFHGWFVNDGDLATPLGLAIGVSRAEVEALYGADITEESTLGTEFFTGGDGGISGLFSAEVDGEPVEAMWSGTACVFR